MHRLKEDLTELGRFGRSPSKRVERCDQLDSRKGLNRLAGSEENRKARNYVVHRMKQAGLEVKIDKTGNIFARRPGLRTNQGTVMSGSHLDTVKNGGMFDGSVGVLGALEAVRRMKDEGFENQRPVEVVVFTAEEGSAFGQTLLGSSALTGKIKLAEALSIKSDEGVTVGEALENIGYKGEFERSLDDVEYFVEMHIEQGPFLDREKVPVGIVENISGLTWIIARIEGEENHAGTTSMQMRKDALVAASDIVSLINRRANEMAEKLGNSARGTVGKLNVYPNGINIIPGKVEMGIDIRDIVQENMLSLKDEILKAMKALEDKYGVKTTVSLSLTHLPVHLSDDVVKVIESSCKQVQANAKRMNSGAAHDAQNMAGKVKTGMIFVPSFKGISHSPLEWTEWQDIEKGVRVLTQTLKNLSSL